MFRLLDRYVARTFLSTFGVVLFFILAIFTVITVILRIDSVLEVQEGLAVRGLSGASVLGRYCLLSLPFILLQFLPFVTVIAGAISFVRLMRSNEIVPMIAAGRSPGRIAVPVFVAGGVLVLGMYAMQQWAVARVSDAHYHLESLLEGRYDGECDSLPQVADRDGNSWSVEVYTPLRKRMRGARVIRFRDSTTGRDAGTLEVPAADYLVDGPGGEGWYATEAVLVAAEGVGRRETLPPDRPLPIVLRPEDLERKVVETIRSGHRALSIGGAAAFARENPDDPAAQVGFHSLLTWPLANLLLLLLCLPFIFRMGDRNLFVALGIALLLSAGYFMADHLCRDLGVRGTLPPLLAAWLPVVLAVSAALAIRDALRI